MDDYNFWSDLFDTWQSTADWIKALAILTPPASALAALALVLHHRRDRHRARRGAKALPGGALPYTILRDETGQLHIIRHRAELGCAPTLCLPNPVPARSPHYSPRARER